MRKSTVISFVMSLLVLGFVMIAPSFAQNSTLTYGDTATGEITNENPEVLYLFNGTAGDVVLVEMTMLEEGLDPYLSLKNSNGDVIAFNDDGGFGLNSVLGPITLPTDGTYTIVATRYMQGEGTSEGQFELTLSQTTIATLNLNENVTLILDENQPRVAYQYVSDGSRVLKLIGTTNVNLDEFITQVSVTVLDESGNMITSSYLDQQGNLMIDPLYLQSAENYMIVVEREPSFDTNGEQGTMEGSVEVQLTLSPAELQTISLGDTVTGAVTLGESDYYIFNADAGTIIRVEGTQPEGETPYEVVFYNQEGMQFAGSGIPYNGSEWSFVQDPIRLDNGNEYLMVVRQINYGTEPAQGNSNYTVTLSLTSTPTLESGVEVTGTVGGDTYEQVYRFEGLGGQVIRITLESASQNYAPSISVDGERPENAEESGYWGYILNAGSALPASVSYEVTLPQDGVYLFHVSNGRSGPNGPLLGNYILLFEVVE